MEADGMTASVLVFHRDRLSKLKNGISRVLEAFADGLQENGAIACGDPAEMIKTLQEIEDTAWGQIREHFLDSHLPSDGQQEGRGIARLLLDFTNKLDDVKEALEDRLNILTQQKELKHQQEIKELQKKLSEEKNKASDLKWKHQELSETSSAEKHFKVVLQQQLKEKQDIIAQLQRNGTVQLWEKEKTKLLEGSKQREDNLTRELIKLRETHEDMKDRLQRRIKDLEDKVKLERMKDIVSKITPQDGIEADLESLKRHMYTKENEVARLEQELINQQKHIVGCIKGIQRDFRIMGERQEGRRLRKDDMQKMNAILDAILSGAREARLDITKADLPLHYIALPEDIVAHPGKKVSRPSILSPVVNRHLETIDDSQIPSSPAPLHRIPSLDLPHPNSTPALSSPVRSSTVPSIETSPANGQTSTARTAQSGKVKISIDEVVQITKSPRGGRKSHTTFFPETPRSPLLIKRRTVSSPVPPNLAALKQQSISPRDQTRVVSHRPPSKGGMMLSARKAQAKSTFTGPGEFALDKEHPELIDKETGILDTATSRTCYPNMTEDQIREHYSQFKKYDTNGDYCLDFVEMTQAIQSTVADYYKPRQIKEAMVETDVDQSGSVDFYEYLGISTMLLMKVGKSEIFRSSMVKHAGGSISKVCSIQ